MSGFAKVLGLGLAVLALTARAAPPPDDSDFGVFVGYEDRPGFFYDVKAGLGLASFAARSGSTNRVAPLGGLGASYFFGPSWGSFAELHFTDRALTALGASATANFADLVVGVVFNRGAGMLNSVARETYRLGLVYARPLGSFRGAYSPSFSGESQGAIGVHLEHQATFPIADHFGMGYSLWLKGILTSAVKATSVTFIDAGVGLVVTFF